MCMSEPGAGTDVLGMQTSAVADGRRLRAQRRQDVDHQRRVSATPSSATSSWSTRGSAKARAISSRCSSSRRAAGLQPGPEDPRQARHARLDYGRAGVRGLPRSRAENLVGGEGDAVLHMMRNLELERADSGGHEPRHRAAHASKIMNRYAQERTSVRQAAQRLRSDPAAHRRIVRRVHGRACVRLLHGSTLSLDDAGNRLDSDGVKLYSPRRWPRKWPTAPSRCWAATATSGEYARGASVARRQAARDWRRHASKRTRRTCAASSAGPSAYCEKPHSFPIRFGFSHLEVGARPLESLCCPERHFPLGESRAPGDMRGRRRLGECLGTT